MNMMKVSDYVIKRLQEYGVKDVFMITGGGAMHLNDSVGKSKMRYICNHHEQASAMGAEGYSRVSGKLGVVIITSGPGGTNCLTGVMGQWTDSVPVLYISGQVKFETTTSICPELPLRQLGDQEVNIIQIVKPLTKFAAMVVDPMEIRSILEKAIAEATSGRPGPVWIDIPLNIQGAIIDETQLKPYVPEVSNEVLGVADTAETWEEAVRLILTAKRPLVIAGHGIRLAGAKAQLLQLLALMKLPVVTTFNGMDLVPHDNPNYIGRIGTIGDRAGNFALQNADLVLCLGTRNNIRQISYSWKYFARSAKKIIVDIDRTELEKPTVRPDLAVHANVLDFLGYAQKRMSGISVLPDWNIWLSWCLERRKKYPTVLPSYLAENKPVNMYIFIAALTKVLSKGAVVVSGNGSACVALFQAAVVKDEQRMFWNSGCASMGYDLPAAIGASLSTSGDTVCLAGDGSFQMNIQELQTVINYSLPLKIFYLNNNGYLSIQQTQDNLFEGNRVGCDASTGVSLPDIQKVAAAYGIAYQKIEEHKSIEVDLDKILKTPGPILVEVLLDPRGKFSPKLSAEKRPDGTIVSKPLEDMFPFLDRNELKENMIVPIIY